MVPPVLKLLLLCLAGHGWWGEGSFADDAVCVCTCEGCLVSTAICLQVGNMTAQIPHLILVSTWLSLPLPSDTHRSSLMSASSCCWEGAGLPSASQR